MDTNKLIGRRIKELRRKKGLSQVELAEKANVGTHHLSAIESGKGNPTLDTFVKLALVLDAELKQLFDFGHQIEKKDLRRIINNYLKNASEDKLRLIIKFINTLDQ